MALLQRRRTLLVLTGALLAIAAYVAASQYRRAEGLAEDLAFARAYDEAADARLAGYARLDSADALLFAGQYDEAARAFEALEADSALAGRGVGTDYGLRYDHLARVTALYREVDTLRELAGRPPREVIVRLPAQPVARALAPLPLESSRPGEYDSLNFALRKAEMRIRSLEGRLRQRSGGNYLTFESTQGNDVYYVGDVRRGKANGRGVALLSSGSRYQGEWRDNRRHGEGTFYWPDGAYYEGQYVEDERDGRGTYHFPDGSVFVGEWEADLRNGEGIYYDKDGEVVARGLWDDDELVQRARRG